MYKPSRSVRYSPNTIRSNLQTRVKPRASRPRGGAGCIRLLLALGLAAFAIITFLSSKTLNPITGEEQYITITKDQEIALGLQAVPELTSMYGGLEDDPQAQAAVDYIGERLLRTTFTRPSQYPFEFHLLSDDEKVNAFALPGGPVFITNALFSLLKTEDQLAGVLGHEIGHVLARHGAQHIAKQELTQGLTGAVVLATYDPRNPSSQMAAYLAAIVGQLVNMKYSREDELESDFLGVCMLFQAGYTPEAMLDVMQILDEATQGARPPEFFSTHPNPENRIEQIRLAIDNLEECPK